MPAGHPALESWRRRCAARAFSIIVALVLAIALGVSVALWPPRVDVPPRGFEIVDVTLVEPGRSRRTHVTLRGAARIDRIEPATARSGAERFVLPGLIDLHVHHPPFFAVGERELFSLLFLAHGVTGVRDAGTFVGSLAGHAERIRKGRRPGPRVFRCGRILDQPPASWFGARLVEGVHDVRAAVDAEADAGADCIKTYNNVGERVLARIGAAAAARGLPRVAHVPPGLPLASVGTAEVQHMMGLTDDWSEVTEREIATYVADSRAHRMRHTPTFVVFVWNGRLDEYARLRDEPVAALLPRHYRELLWNPARNLRLDSLSHQSSPGPPQRVPAMLRAVDALHAAGVPVLAGTDTPNPFVVPGAALQQELELLARSGLGLEGAWAAATWRAGEALRAPGLGTLAEGAPADLLVFREDPTRDLAALASLETVVADGRAFARADLDAAVKRHLAYADSWLPRTLAWLEARLIVRAMGR